MGRGWVETQGVDGSDSSSDRGGSTNGGSSDGSDGNWELLAHSLYCPLELGRSAPRSFKTENYGL